MVGLLDAPGIDESLDRIDRPLGGGFGRFGVHRPRIEDRAAAVSTGHLGGEVVARDATVLHVDTFRRSILDVRPSPAKVQARTWVGPAARAAAIAPRLRRTDEP